REDRPLALVELEEGRVATPAVRGAVQLADQVLVEVLGEPLAGPVQVEPLELVDLAVRPEFSVQGGHQPVAHDLGSPVLVLVAGLTELALQPAADSHLLLHLPYRSVLEGVVGLELAL